MTTPDTRRRIDWSIPSCGSVRRSSEEGRLADGASFADDCLLER